MPKIRHAHPDKIACEPFPTTAAETKVNHGFAQTQQKVEATKLKVLYGNMKVPQGFSVIVAGEDCRSIWGKKVLTMPDTGERFIMVPMDAVLVIESTFDAEEPNKEQAADKEQYERELRA